MKNEKERKLSTQELKRKEVFDKECQRLINEGYQRDDLSIGVVAANVWALVIMLPFVALSVIFYFTYNHGSLTLSFSFLNYFIGLFALIALHEAIHGLVWAIFCKKHFKAISFGFIWQMVTPYCTCNEPLRKYQYIIGAIMPTIIVGFLPVIIATMAGSSVLMLIAIVMIFAGGGDALIVCKLLRHRTNGQEVIYMDHPYAVGGVAFRR